MKADDVTLVMQPKRPCDGDEDDDPPTDNRDQITICLLLTSSSWEGDINDQEPVRFKTWSKFNEDYFKRRSKAQQPGEERLAERRSTNRSTHRSTCIIWLIFGLGSGEDRQETRAVVSEKRLLVAGIDR